MKKFRIDPEVKAVLRPLTPDERASLKLSIQTDGCRDPLVVGNVLGDHILADGHSRHDLWQEEHFQYTTVEMKFPSKDLLIEWVKHNQAARRNLDTKEMEAYRMGRRQTTESQPHGGDRRSEESKSHSET